MHKIIFCYLFSIFCLGGCVHKHSQTANADVICIAVNPNDSKKLDMETLFSSIEPIFLESSAVSLFRKCDKMIFFEDKYYILDRRSACISIFNTDGTFWRNSKSKQGNGPGEYYCIVDFDITKAKYIEILDASAYKIKRYDNEFNFINEINIPKKLYPINTFKCLDKDLYAFYSSSSSNATDEVKTYSFKQNRIVESTKGYIPKSFLNVGISQSYSFYELDEEVFFSFPYPNDKIYKIDKNEGCIREIYNYDFGRYSFPFSEVATHAYVFEDIIKGSKNYAFPIYRSENKNFLFTYIMYQEKQHLLLYEKTSRQSKLYSCTFSNGKVLIPPTFTDDVFLYVVAEPSWLKDIITEKLLVGKSKKRIESVTEDDNPIILKYRLRK